MTHGIEEDRQVALIAKPVIVQTFIREGGIERGRLVLVRDYMGAIADPRHIPGAIRLQIYGKEVIGLEEWDYVAELWAYLLDCLGQVVAGATARTSFPDQPIDVTMTPNPRTGTVCVAVQIGSTTRSAEAPLCQLVSVLAEEARDFYTTMHSLVPSDSEHYAYVRRQADELLERQEGKVEW